MSRLTYAKVTPQQRGLAALTTDAARRLESLVTDQCPVEVVRAITRVHASQSCGKCTPCRVGLAALLEELDAIVDGFGDEGSLERISDLARAIIDSADCAIGTEAARMALTGVAVFADDFASHISADRCSRELGLGIPCRQQCPAHVDVPSYLALIHAGRYEDALRVIRNDNPLPTVCGYVCEHPCEMVCRRRLVDDAVNICGLKRFAADEAHAYPAPPRQPSTGKRVAIIGGGPAGLSCAYYLALMGHEPRIYERLPHLGGMLRYGIPDYRLPQDKLDEDIDFIRSVGVEAQTNCEIGTDLSFEEIIDASDAVYVSIGDHDDKKLGIDGEDAEGVISAVELLRRCGEGDPPDFTGKRVVIVGGGNVAMDAARSAKRLGAASVECVYRRRIADMSALPEEIEEAMAEGCQITQLQAPLAIERDAEGAVAALIVKPQMPGPIRGGRPTPEDAQAPARTIPCEVIIVAIGQALDAEMLKPLLAVERGKIVTFEDGRIASASATPIHAGGDAVTGPATVISAIAHGKAAAANIDEALGFHHEVYDEVDIPEPASDLTPTGRVNLRPRLFSESAQDFELASFGMSLEEALQESSRCLRCDVHGFGATCTKGARKW